MTSTRHGFTLVELLVVISIISLLSSLLFATFKDVRTRALDAQRNVIATQYRTALELYNLAHDRYPYAGTHSAGVYGHIWCIGDHTSETCHPDFEISTDVNDELRPYVPELPLIAPVRSLLGGPQYSCAEWSPTNVCEQAALQWFLQGEDPICALGATQTRALLILSPSYTEITRCTLILR